MNVSGKNFRLTPGVRFYSFVLNDVSLSNATGVAEIGFSGSGQMKSFAFNNGKVYDFEGRYVFDLGSGESIDISGQVETGQYKYFINGEKTYHSNYTDSGLQKVFFNTTGCNLNLTPKLNADVSLAGYGVDIETGFYAGDQITGHVTNSTDIPIHTYASRISYNYTDKAAFSGNISGQVPAMSKLGFTLQDLQGDRGNTSVNFDLDIDTSIGLISKPFNLSRLSNLTGDLHIIQLSAFNSATIDIPLSGSGLANSFVYENQPSGLDIQTLQYNRYDYTGVEKEKTLNWHIQPNNYTGTHTGTGTFVTGFQSTNSGFYEVMPDVSFLSYNQLRTASYNPSNLFTPACADTLAVTFNAISGSGQNGAGTAYLKDVAISLYGSTNFKTITGIDMTNLGTGYNYPPAISLATGGSCYDVPRVSGNSYIYTPFTGSGVLSPLADYLHGIPLTGESHKIISGSNRTGIGITGVQITNVGSGYNTGSGFTPGWVVSRNGNDGFAAIATASGFDAAGTFSFNTSGDSYSLANNWIFKTGSVFSDIIPVAASSAVGGGSGFSGVINMKKNEEALYFYSYHKQTTLDIEPEVALRFFVDQPAGSSVIVTGRSYTNDYSGMLYSLPPEVNTGIFIEF